MLEYNGKYGSAKVFTDNIEPSAVSQIIQLLNQEFTEGSKIRVMPDVHAGMGCTIGTTMTITDKIVPNLVGVDIGCGMETLILRDERLDLQRLDKVVHSEIPSGFGVRKNIHSYASKIDLTELVCAKHVGLDRAEVSIGTLGGGNHFIELDTDSEGVNYLVIHSGSRNLGKQIAEHYQKSAANAHKGITRILAYVEGQMLEDYLHDMAIAQSFADLNRKAIAREIVKNMKLKVDDEFTTIHNYIDIEAKILRKGAISARAGERVLIPMNMRDGSLLCTGKGNADWNESAPHGAGRLMSRKSAKESITLTAFKSDMEGIYSSTVGKSTLDEAPGAYKPMEEIVSRVGDTVDIVKTIKPLYNYKAAGE
ncbi:MAG: RtcB family protein [Oscillospiraceae bacterium]|jgi:RNA-splicing ligase RtcB|nr:RtcB family protein [Oscillospiraceae bacterium]